MIGELVRSFFVGMSGALLLGLAWPSGASAQDPCRGVDCGGAGTCFPEGDLATCLCEPGFEADGDDCVRAPRWTDPLRERHRSGVGDEVVAIARAQLGLGPYRVGRRWNGDLAPLHEYLALHEMWCTDFVAWVYRAAEVPFDGGDGGWQIRNNHAARAWFRQRDLWIDRDSDDWESFEPEPGDYVRIHTARYGHSAIVDRVEGETLFTIEGNYGNEVRVTRHPRFRDDRRIDGFGILALDNAPPVVDAGGDELLAWDEFSVHLDGRVTDDGPEDELTVSWSRKEGPGLVTFEDPWSQSTWATFSVPGAYVLQLAADDGALAATSEITVELNEEEVEWVDLEEPREAEAESVACSAGGDPEGLLGLVLPALVLVGRRRRMTRARM
jgi:uncharacterized protein (TIGR03382 family)